VRTAAKERLLTVSSLHLCGTTKAPGRVVHGRHCPKRLSLSCRAAGEQAQSASPAFDRWCTTALAAASDGRMVEGERACLKRTSRGDEISLPRWIRLSTRKPAPIGHELSLQRPIDDITPTWRLRPMMWRVRRPLFHRAPRPLDRGPGCPRQVIRRNVY